MHLHEFILYGQIPTQRERQLLSILAGVTASLPVHIHEQALIFAQTRLPDQGSNKKLSGKQAQQTKKRPDLIYHKLVRSIEKNEPGPWTIRAEQTPDPSISNVTSRDFEEREAVAADLEKFKSVDWYRYKNQVVTTGSRFIHGHAIIRVLRWHRPTGDSKGDPIDGPPPTADSLTVLDPSGSWLVEATVRVDEASNSTLADQAKKELLEFMTLIDGVVDLYAPDRLSLDTRVKNV